MTLFEGGISILVITLKEILPLYLLFLPLSLRGLRLEIFQRLGLRSDRVFKKFLPFLFFLESLQIDLGRCRHPLRFGLLPKVLLRLISHKAQALG